VVAGAVAKLLLKNKGISVTAFVRQIGPLSLGKDFSELDLSVTEGNNMRCPDEIMAKKMMSHVEKLKQEGDSCGGVIQCVILDPPPGLGEPVFDKLHALLAHGMMSINAVKGFEIGSGFDGVRLKGSEQNDAFLPGAKGEYPKTKTNNSGGVQGGISNGMPIYFNVAFKPVSSIGSVQQTVDKSGNVASLNIEGRHDPCVVPRAVPIVEAMAALVLVDFVLRAGVSRL
jgi:chorismate synthase